MNQLTPEQLDMIKKLQPKIIEAMGPVQYGDDYAIEVLPEQWEIETQGINRKGFNDYYTTLERSRQGYNILFIPKPIDWQNPGRGLERMLNIEANVQISHYLNKTRVVFSINETLEYCTIEASDPFTALLKALWEQENFYTK